MEPGAGLQGKPLTPASDIYSLAVILYEVLTGKLPFDAKSAMDYIQLHVMQKPIPLGQRVAGRTFPPLLEQIMDRALAKRSEERFSSAADFGAALQAVLDGAARLPAVLTAPTVPIVTHPQSPPLTNGASSAGRRPSPRRPSALEPLGEYEDASSRRGHRVPGAGRHVLALALMKLVAKG